MQLTIFIVTAGLSLTASVLLVRRLERVGDRLGVSEAVLGLLAALAADAPEITSAVTALAGGHATVGLSVTLGSNVFNLAALLGLSAVVAGRIRFRRRAVLLEGGLGLWIAFSAFVAVGGLLEPVVGLILALLAFVPYLALSALRPAGRIHVPLPRAWAAWLTGALADEEAELAVAIHPRPGGRADVLVVLGAIVVVVVASVAMEEMAISLGSQAGLAPIFVGGVILASVTSLPNAVAAVHLSSRGRAEATLSEGFNSNLFNVLVGLLLPGALLGLADHSADALFVAGSYVALTAAVVVLALWQGGLDRRTGAVIILGYLLFAATLSTR